MCYLDCSDFSVTFFFFGGHFFSGSSLFVSGTYTHTPSLSLSLSFSLSHTHTHTHAHTRTHIHTHCHGTGKKWGWVWRREGGVARASQQVHVGMSGSWMCVDAHLDSEEAILENAHGVLEYGDWIASRPAADSVQDSEQDTEQESGGLEVEEEEWKGGKTVEGVGGVGAHQWRARAEEAAHQERVASLKARFKERDRETEKLCELRGWNTGTPEERGEKFLEFIKSPDFASKSIEHFPEAKRRDIEAGVVYETDPLAIEAADLEYPGAKAWLESRPRIELHTDRPDAEKWGEEGPPASVFCDEFLAGGREWISRSQGGGGEEFQPIILDIRGALDESGTNVTTWEECVELGYVPGMPRLPANLLRAAAAATAHGAEPVLPKLGRDRTSQKGRCVDTLQVLRYECIYRNTHTHTHTD